MLDRVVVQGREDGRRGDARRDHNGAKQQDQNGAKHRVSLSAESVSLSQSVSVTAARLLSLLGFPAILTSPRSPLQRSLAPCTHLSCSALITALCCWAAAMEAAVAVRAALDAAAVAGPRPAASGSSLPAALTALELMATHLQRLQRLQGESRVRQRRAEPATEHACSAQLSSAQLRPLSLSVSV